MSRCSVQYIKPFDKQWKGSVMMDTYTLTNFQRCPNNYLYSCQMLSIEHCVCFSYGTHKPNVLLSLVLSLTVLNSQPIRVQDNVSQASCVYTAECLCALLFPPQILLKSWRHFRKSHLSLIMKEKPSHELLKLINKGLFVWLWRLISEVIKGTR